MVIFCTNCGTKLDDDDSFCMNCGTKVDNFNNKEKGSLFKSIKDDKDKKKAKKELKRLCGGFKLSKTYSAELSKHGLLNHYYFGKHGFHNYVGSTIKKQLETEIKSGQVKSENVQFRLNELILEYKTQREKEKRIIDELIESEDIQSKIKENKINETHIISIKQILEHTKVNTKEENEIKKEIQSNFNTLLEKEMSDYEKNNLLENQVEYVENRIKKSHPNIKLATFEKRYVNGIKLYGNIDQMKKELNSISKEIINTHEKIGDYDFAGMLIEEAGLTNAVDPIGLNKRVRKESNYTSYVFLKICDDNMKIVGSNIRTINLNTRLGIDMTIFFKDILSVNYATDWKENGEIKFDLNNRKFKLIANKEDEKYLEEFYKLLEYKWKEFKNNTVDSINKNEISAADELMKYAELYEKGLLTEEEFNAMKKKLLGL